MDKLISMTDFVLNGQETADYIKLYDGCFEYAKFLKQPLTLGMFVPCKFVEGVWVILREPKEYQNWLEVKKHGGYSLCHNSNEYQKALDGILFSGIEFADVQPSTTYNYYHVNGMKIFEANNQYNFFPVYGFITIEDLVKYNLVLTESAKKQIGL